MRIFAMVPARIGSMRLKMKNMALLGGRPLISYAIEAAKASGVFERVVVNADHELFRSIAEAAGAEFYLRPEALGSSTTTSDEVVNDFLLKFPADVLAWVNPTSPLQTGNEVKSVVDHFLAQGLDSLITVKNEQVHCVLNGKPVNFNDKERFARTQDLAPVQSFVYSVMMWRREAFLRAFEKDGFALLCGRVGYFPVSRLSACLVKTQEDLRFIEALLTLAESSTGEPVEYDPRAQVLARNTG